jgi:DNA-binding response OmpR family regulator
MARILLIDDERDLAEVTADSLAHYGHEVAVEYNGVDGLAALMRRPADLVILDIQMPKMSGVEVLRWMRTLTDLRSVPVIHVTAMKELVPTGADALHDAVVTKPYRIETLLSLLDDLLPRPAQSRLVASVDGGSAVSDSAGHLSLDSDSAGLPRSSFEMAGQPALERDAAGPSSLISNSVGLHGLANDTGGLPTPDSDTAGLPALDNDTADQLALDASRDE